MSELRWGDSTYALDAQGFLTDPDRWDTGFVEGMARRLGLAQGLTVMQWKVVLWVRRYYDRQWDVPRIHQACRACGLSRRGLRNLFQHGYQRGVCRLAGIPYAVIAACHFALTYETRGERSSGPATTPPGFLVDFSSWDPDFARRTANECGLPVLTAKHWQVIEYLRKTFSETGHLPTVRRTCIDTGIGLDEWTLLFPGGFRNAAARCAGLPAAAR